MKNLVILIIITLFTACTVSERKIEAPIMKEKKIEEKSIEETYNFRQAKWGMLRKDVVQLEIDKEFVEINDGENIALYDDILGYTFLVIYKFEDSKLVEGIYNLMDNEDRFYELKKSLEIKYGIPDEEEKDMKAVWETKNTIINLFRKKNNTAIAIQYLSKDYINRIEDRELKEEIMKKKADEKIKENLEEVKDKF